MSALETLRTIFLESPSSPALVTPTEVLDRGELAAQAWSRVDHWRGCGLVEGACILIQGRNRREYLVSILAASLGGFRVASVSERATEQELVHIRGLVHADLEWIDPPADLPVPGEPRDPVFRDVQVSFFTSGTTSLPKGVVHRFATLLENARAFNVAAGLDSGCRMLHVMPAGYMAGLLNTFLSPLVAGGATVLGTAFDARGALTFWDLPMRSEVNAMWLSPTMASALCRLLRDEAVPTWTRRNLRHVFVGTAALHSSTRDEFRARFGVDCLQSYGMTECMFVSVNHPSIANPGNSVGLPLEGVQLRVVRRDGEEYGSPDAGDLEVLSPHLLDGYLAAGATTESPLDAQGWLATGDIAVIEPSGHIQITGRRKDLIIRGGMNLSPKRIEETILQDPRVRECVVIGETDPFWGEVPVACLVVEEGMEANVQELSARCRAALGAEHVPARFHAMDSFPRNANGKIVKHLLSERIRA